MSILSFIKCIIRRWYEVDRAGFAYEGIGLEKEGEK